MMVLTHSLMFTQVVCSLIAQKTFLIPFIKKHCTRMKRCKELLQSRGFEKLLRKEVAIDFAIKKENMLYIWNMWIDRDTF